ncbi:hypothetical protein TWF481_011432 [Arthrobotrys musiformis]|uniref:Uncharacterized protein n=1 Tax=Arthrobotrys musiformis TaxID=47236 RepID=A0AAV9VYE3_9PEZI
MLLELCLIVGGVIFYKNRKKRKAEDAARQEWYNSGRQSPQPIPQGYPPYNGNNYQDPPKSPSQKPPVVYGNSQQQQGSTPQYGQPVAGPEQGDAPPAYASLRPQSQTLGYERQDFYSSRGGDQKGGRS